MVACYELMLLCLYICKFIFMCFLGKETRNVKNVIQAETMNQSDFNDEIIRHIGGKSKNNLNEILNNYWHWFLK